MFRYSVSLVLQFSRDYVSLQCVSYCNSEEVRFRYSVSLVLQLYRGYVSLQCVSCIAIL